MSSWTWVCFDCRRTVRRDVTVGKVVRCPECAEECLSIGYKARVPVRSNKKGWAKLRISRCQQDIVNNPLEQVIQQRQSQRVESLKRFERLQRRSPAWLQKYLEKKESGET